MISLLFPWALVLALPALALWWWSGRGRWSWLRLFVLLLVVAAASGPRMSSGSGGSDVVAVLDLSGSIGKARERTEEVLQLIGRQRGPQDRLAVVACGAGIQIAQGPDATALPKASDLNPGEDGSDLAAGLDAALAMVPPGRTARVVLISDGEFTGRAPHAAAARLGVAGIPVDALALTRSTFADAAVAAIELPGALRLGESFLGAIRFSSTERERRTWTAHRGTTLIASGTVELLPGAVVTVTFADRPERPGIADYSVVLDAANDREPRNNHARGAVRIEGSERILVMSKGNNIATALRSATMSVVQRQPGRLQLDDLLSASAVVLDDVPAEALGAQGLRDLAQWVERAGGGLVMLGGRSSGGAGGWHKSAVEGVLPVSFELRDEHRKLSVAMAIAIDRSGSMSVPSGDGRPKIALANDGACAAIELLGPRDQVAVFAVDSAAHEIIALTRIEHPAALVAKAQGITSQGGGIYIYEALAACGRALAKVERAGALHIVLFADANDSEEPGDYQLLLERFRAAGITVSVIGMGFDTDSDAKLLIDIALRGGGRCMFATEPGDIPRLFAQETMLVARTTWIDQAAVPQPQAALAAVVGGGGLPGGDWPLIQGFNLAWAKPTAQVLATAPCDPAVPAAAIVRAGAGRTAWLGFANDSAANAALQSWSGYVPLVAGLTRWCAGANERELGRLSAQRFGRTVELRLECDPDQRATWSQSRPIVSVIGGPAQVSMQPVDDASWSGRFELPDHGVVVPAARIGEHTLLGPALTALYPAEAEPRFERTSGGQVLSEIVRLSAGSLRTDLSGVFANPPSPGGIRSVVMPLLIAALFLMLFELVLRRLDVTGWVGSTWSRLWAGLRSRFTRSTAVPANPTPMVAISPVGNQPTSSALASGSPRGAPTQPLSAAAVAADAKPLSAAQPPAAVQPSGSINSALEELRRRRR